MLLIGTLHDSDGRFPKVLRLSKIIMRSTHSSRSTLMDDKKFHQTKSDPQLEISEKRVCQNSEHTAEVNTKIIYLIA